MTSRPIDELREEFAVELLFPPDPNGITDDDLEEAYVILTGANASQGLPDGIVEEAISTLLG